MNRFACASTCVLSLLALARAATAQCGCGSTNFNCTVSTGDTVCITPTFNATTGKWDISIAATIDNSNNVISVTIEANTDETAVGEVALPPFHVHNQDCIPPHNETAIEDAFSITLRFDDPVTWDQGILPFNIHTPPTTAPPGSATTTSGPSSRAGAPATSPCSTATRATPPSSPRAATTASPPSPPAAANSSATTS